MEKPKFTGRTSTLIKLFEELETNAKKEQSFRKSVFSENVSTNIGFITPHEFNQIIQSKNENVLIIDCRKPYYMGKRIRHNDCLSIPANNFFPGMSTDSIQNVLCEHNSTSLMALEKLDDFQRVVMCDTSVGEWTVQLEAIYQTLIKMCANATIQLLKGGVQSLSRTFPGLLIDSRRNTPSKEMSKEYYRKSKSNKNNI